MNRKTWIWASALTIVVTACSAAGSSESTSTTVAAGQTTSTPADSSPSTSITSEVGDRQLSVVDCASPPKEVAIFCEAYDLIKTRYVDDVDDADLVEAAIAGLATLDGADADGPLVCAAPTDEFVDACEDAPVAADDSAEAAEAMVAGLASFALDPNSGYLDSDSLTLLQEQQQGQIEGIGALVSPEDSSIEGEDNQCAVVSETCRILIVSTISGAPAEAAGLERDDVIVAVDGQPILGMTVDEVTAMVRGPAGTPVTLTMERGDELFDVTITRAAVVIPVIEQETFGDVGYVRLRSFNALASEQFERAIFEVLEDGVDDLIIDLRDNPGGFLDTAIEVTSIFLEDGDVVMTEGPDEELNYAVTGAAIVPDDVDVFVVVNKGSASASEVVSAVLQERGRATVIGENTFGKNTVQQRFSLSNGGALKLTIARWLTPEGLDFGGGGVAPDVEIDVGDLTPEELVEAIAGI